MTRWTTVLGIRALYHGLTRLLLRFSPSEVVRGIPVTVAFATATNRPRLFEEIDSSLALIERYDPRRFARIRKDVRGILLYQWSTKLNTLGLYSARLRVCHVNAEVFNNSNPGRSVIGACVVVHEATHARLDQLGVTSASFNRRGRARIERICTRAELAFASRLPNSDAFCAVLAQQLASPDSASGP
jgi:hypothetical protein